MKGFCYALPLFFLLSCSTTRYYIVRHAEKQAAANMMTSDVPLSPQGEQRAQALRDELKNKHIRHIYSTNYQRTRATAQPLSQQTGVPIQTYDPKDTGFISTLKKNHQGNVLVVGHSNTVDDLVNGLTGKALLKDLPETEYGDLFIVKRKGKKYFFSQGHFGQ